MVANATPLVLFFGSVRRGEYDTLLAAGLPLGLLRDTTSPNSRHVPHGFAYLDEAPFTAGVDELVARVEAVRRIRNVACLVTVFDGHVELAAEVCARLRFPGLDPKIADAVRDKTLMHDRLVAALGPSCTGRYAPVRDIEDAMDFADRNGFPVVLKPQRLHSSIHVTPCRNAAELDAAVIRLLATVPLFAENGGAQAKLHIEEYLSGTNHSVEVVSLDGQAWPTPVIDVVTGADLGADDFHHFARVTPSALGVEEQEAAMALAVEAACTLGIQPGIAHVELICSPAGPRIVEVGGRPGANRHRLLHLGRGIDLCRAYVDVLTGQQPQLRPTRNVPVAVVTPYPSRVGILRGFRSLDRVRELPSVRSVEQRAAVGATVGTPRDGAASPLSVELVADSREALINDLVSLAAMRPQIFDLEPLPTQGRHLDPTLWR